jgi:hypothetical protein
MEYNFNIDELITLINNIINNNNDDLKNNILFNDIIKEYKQHKINNEILTNEIKVMKDEIKELKLLNSSLEECIRPNDQEINYLIIKNQNLKFKNDKLKTYLKKILIQNNSLTQDNYKLFKENNITIDKIKTEYLNDKQTLNEQIIKINTMFNDLSYNYNNLVEEKNIIDNNNKLLIIELEEYKYKYENEINILNISSVEQNKIIMDIEEKITLLNNTIDEKNKKIMEQSKVIMEQCKEIEEFKIKLINIDNEINSIKNISENKINILEYNNNILIEKIETLKKITDGKNNILEIDNKILNDNIPILENNKNDNNIFIGGEKIQENNNEFILNTENIGIWEKSVGNKKTQLKNKIFFDNEIKMQMTKDDEQQQELNILEEKTNNTKNTNNTNISFSTDYMVSYLQNENKVIPKEKRVKTINNKISSISNSTEDNYIDISKIPNIIIDTDNSNNNDINNSNNNDINDNNNYHLKEMKNIIVNDDINIKNIVNDNNDNIIINNIGKNNNNNDIIIGGKIHKNKNKNNKMYVHLINGVKKMVIGEELTTLTEQEFNIEDKKTVHLIYNKKIKRYKREQDKENKLINAFK